MLVITRKTEQSIVIDGRNALDGSALVKMGYTYEGVGTRPRP